MFSALLVTLLLHPVHETVGEAQWNHNTHRLEVALRIDALDEQWLRKRHGNNALQKAPAKDGQWQIDYLRDRFRITESPKRGEPDSTVYRWVGQEVQRGHVWWFFEIEPPDKLSPNWLEQRVLLEKEADHVNRIVILGQLPKQTLILTMQQPRVPFPSVAPSDKPSVAPSDKPSVAPSDKPSVAPSDKPTVVPSKKSSAEHDESPSGC